MIGLTIFALAQASTPAATPAPTKTAGSDKLICRRFIETGSLVRGYRTCKTKADWERDRDLVRANATTGIGSCANAGGGSGRC